MEQMYTVKKVAEVMGCSNDTARQRMRQMSGVINVGTARRHQLMVTEEALEEWLRNHRINGIIHNSQFIIHHSETMEKPEFRPRVTISADGKMARIDRRTGLLKRK